MALYPVLLRNRRLSSGSINTPNPGISLVHERLEDQTCQKETTSDVSSNSKQSAMLLHNSKFTLTECKILRYTTIPHLIINMSTFVHRLVELNLFLIYLQKNKTTITNLNSVKAST